MKRLDLAQAALPLAHTLFALAGGDAARQAQALALLADRQRWDALLALARQWTPRTARALLRPQGAQPYLYQASACAAASVAVLDGLRALGGLPRSDAEVAAQARVPAEWERSTWPTAAPTLRHWLDAGLRWAVSSGDVARVQWWVAAGASLHHQDADGHNAIQCACTLPMLDWLLAQGVPTDGERRWDGRAIQTLARRGGYAALRRMAAHGVDMATLQWQPLHRLVALGTAQELAAALHGPDGAAWSAQCEARDGWGRTPAMHAAQQGAVDKLVLLRDAGADLQARWREWTMAYWIIASRQPDALRWWLAQSGAAVEEPQGGLGDTPLLLAVENDDAPMAEVLLQAGADPNRYNRNQGCPMNSATSRAMLELLMAHGGDAAHLGRNGARIWLGLPLPDEREPGWLVTCTPQEFAQHHTPRPGHHNGEDITTPFHIAMLESGESAYGAGEAFALRRGFNDRPWRHIWNADRFGQSLTGLPGGRWVQIGGEHEDGYDPDFFIYADVIVHTPPGVPGGAWDRHVHAYPEDVFPPTDFHSATLVDGRIIVIGCLGYPAQRRPGQTPVHALDTATWRMQRLDCTGEAPGWLHGHQAQLVAPGVIEVSGGERFLPGSDGAVEPVPGRWQLDLACLRWRAVA